MTPSLEPLLNARQLGELLGLSVKTIERQASQAPEKLPPRVAAIRLLRWSPPVVRDWLADESRTTARPRNGRPRRR